MANRLGTQVGNYRLMHLLGQGGFAEVYLGEHLHLGTQAAIKLLHAPLAQAPQVEAFRQEARRIAQLVHPHIIRVLEFGFEGELPYLVLEYAPGGSLRQRHPVGAPVPLATVLAYVGQIAEALQYAHDQQVIHRDLKPQNLLLGRRGEVLLADFGISVVAESTSRQSSKEFAGTVAYAAPEQIQGHPRPASDQYALGIVVFEWLTGQLPFTGSLPEVIWKQLQATPPSLRTLVPGVPAEVEQVVLTALAKEPKERFASVNAFATALVQANQVEEHKTILSPAWEIRPVPHSPPLAVAPALEHSGGVFSGAGDPLSLAALPLPAQLDVSPSLLDAPTIRNASPTQRASTPPSHASFGSSLSSPASSEAKRAKIWTPLFTGSFLALFLVGAFLSWLATGGDYYYYMYATFVTPPIFSGMHLTPALVPLIFLCEGLLVVLPLVGLRLIRSKPMRLGLLLQISVGVACIIRSLVAQHLESLSDPLPHLDLVYLVFRYLPLAMSLLVALSMLCFSYGLASWRPPQDMVFTLLQLLGSIGIGVLVTNGFQGGVLTDSQPLLVFGSSVLSAFASLVVLLRPACWKRNWSLALGLALGEGGVLLLIGWGSYFYRGPFWPIDLHDHPTFLAPYVLMVLALMLLIQTERLNWTAHAKQATELTISSS